ncbi:MAG: hypothetical protein HYR63_27110 [Proteobacteria bacterium]|nr:hypothetical protein [Pseudomonadota bacterium]MBI3498983.1 hypothetical protein [Pseudomonadota bacterium]
MSETNKAIDAVRLLRERAGLDYSPELAAAWAEADKLMQEMAQSLPHDLPYAVEPAHIFSARARD